MQKMGLLRNVLKSGHLIRVVHQNPRISSFLGDSLRAFSTAGGTTTQNSSPILDPFSHNPTTGLTYAALTGITTYTTKDDILNFFDDCKLTPEDLKVDYNPSYLPNGMLIQFPSKNAYDNALKTLGRKVHGYRLIWITPHRWASVSSYNGKALLLQGIPRNALQDDIDRLLSGCHHDGTGTSIKIFTRYTGKELTRMAIVEFPSAILARLAYLTTTREFCLNSQVLAQVLY